jgi:hypothetical protein
MDVTAIKTLEVAVSSLSSLLTAALKALKKIPAPQRKTLGACALCGAAVYVAVVAVPAWRKPHVTILDPPSGDLVDCRGSSLDGYCRHAVSGTLSRPLQGEQKIYVAIKESGGDEWWISGGAIQQQDVANRQWEQPWASFGSKASPVQSYSVCAFVTEEQFAPDSKLKVLPNESIVSSMTVSVRRR